MLSLLQFTPLGPTPVVIIPTTFDTVRNHHHHRDAVQSAMVMKGAFESNLQVFPHALDLRRDTEPGGA